MNYINYMSDLIWITVTSYIIIHNMCEFSQDITLSKQMEKLDSIEYSAELAVTSAWKGLSRVKLYDEFPWEPGGGGVLPYLT